MGNWYHINSLERKIGLCKSGQRRVLVIMADPQIIIQIYSSKYKINSLMLTAKKSNSKTKKSLPVKSTLSNLKPNKQPKTAKPNKPLQINQTLLINHPNIDHQTFRIPTSITCPNKESNTYNPYFQLFEKCQRTISTSQYQLLKCKEKSKSKEISREKNKDNNTNKQKINLNMKKKQKSKDLTFSPDSRIVDSNTKRIKKKQRSSRSVDNIKKLSKKIDYKSHSASRSQSAKGNRQELKRKITRTEADDHKRKKSNISDLSLLRNKEEETTQKKTFERSRSKSVKLISQKSKRKSMEKVRTYGQQKCHNELDKIRALREIIEIQKNLRVYLQDSKLTSEGFDDSLVTIKDFSQEEEEESQKIMRLIEEIGDNIEDENLQQKLRRLSVMAERYFEKRDRVEEETLPNKRAKSLMESEFSYSKGEESKENTPLKDHLLSLRLPDVNEEESEDCNPAIEEILQMRLPSSRPVYDHPHSFQTVVSPKSYLSDIDEMLNEKSKINSSKFQRKMDLVYKLYQNQLYSPKTFQSKLQFIESVQVKQYQELDKQIESAYKIKTLINSMKKDKEEIAQLEEVYKEENWDQAFNIIRTEEMQQLRVSPSSQPPTGTSPRQNSCGSDSQDHQIEAVFPQPSFKPLPTSTQGQEVNKQVLSLSEISVIREYCQNVFRILKQSPIHMESFASNLIVPQEYDYRDLLSCYRQSISDRTDDSSLYYYWKQSLDVQNVISQSSIEYILSQIHQNTVPQSLYFQSNLIHQRMILNALNQSLDFERSSYRSHNPPWVTVSSLNHHPQSLVSEFSRGGPYIDKVQQIFNSGVQRLLGWGRHYCGILMESISGTNKIREGIPQDESQCQQDLLRQVRMALMLHGSLIEYDNEMKNMDPTRTEVKLRLEAYVFNSIVREVVQEIIQIPNK